MAFNSMLLKLMYHKPIVTFILLPCTMPQHCFPDLFISMKVKYPSAETCALCRSTEQFNLFARNERTAVGKSNIHDMTFMTSDGNIIITARKHSLRRLCFHRHLSVHRGVSVPPCTTGHMTRGVSVQGVSVQGGLHPGVSVQGVSIQGVLSPGESLSRSSLSGGSLSGSLCPGGFCPGESLSGGSLPRGPLCLGEVSVWGRSLSGGLCPGGSMSGVGVSVWGESLSGRSLSGGLCLGGLWSTVYCLLVTQWIP